MYGSKVKSIVPAAQAKMIGVLLWSKKCFCQRCSEKFKSDPDCNVQMCVCGE